MPILFKYEASAIDWKDVISTILNELKKIEDKP